MHPSDGSRQSRRNWLSSTAIDILSPLESGPEIGRLVGRYAIFDAIASGGMATVHIGKLVGPVGFSRIVAIKRLHENLARDPVFVAMMIDEARLVSRIDHPNVVPTLDVVATDQELYIVMEYVKGESLARLVTAARARGEGIPVGVAVSVIVDALHGLHAAHEARGERGQALEIVHRDVSPQNLLVGIDGIARVADFGVAKAVGRLQATQAGQIKGKLAYMPPEQLLNEGVDRRADIYAAGIVLWEALAGCPLFQRETEAATIGAVLLGAVEPPSAHARSLPEGLDAVVMRALERDPAKRFPTAHAFAVALEDALSLPRPHEIGAWLEPMMTSEFTTRTRRIAEIDAISSVMTAPVTAVATVPVPPRPDSVPPRRPSPRSTLVPAGLLVLVAALAPVAYLALKATPAGSFSPAAVMTREANAVAAVASRLELRALATAVAATDDAAVAASPAVRSAPPPAEGPAPVVASASARSRPGHGSPRKPVGSASPAKTVDCDPPFTFDSAGIKVPKRECLGLR